MFKSRSKAKTPDRARDAKPAVETPKHESRESQPRTLELQDLTKVAGGLLPKGGWGQR
ncbi:hypothetical protein [Azohydromonas sediminis]|jgi:hypothetical protein|uniref:hypothetical protein n=1 Tax=Azohydromonas sediminis TaxID=2259674 RepID=UPI0013C3522F|nr:hypothetical protein [Azohydromonas sediminis]